MKQALIYSLKVWLTTLIMPAIICPYHLVYYKLCNNCILNYYHNSYLSEALDDLLVLLPLLVIYIFTSLIVSLTHAKVIISKIAFQIISTIAILVLLRFMIVKVAAMEMFTFRIELIVSSYILVNALSIWFYKLRPVQQEKLSA